MFKVKKIKKFCYHLLNYEIILKKKMYNDLIFLNLSKKGYEEITFLYF